MFSMIFNLVGADIIFNEKTFKSEKKVSTPPI